MATERISLPSWEEIYRSGQQLNRYPFDAVISFVYHNVRASGQEKQVLELGCGAGNNLWFCQREGLKVAGIDKSERAIQVAGHIVDGDLRVGDFTSLPWPDEFADLVIDRQALSYCTNGEAQQVFSEVRRVLKPNGRFLFNSFSDCYRRPATERTGEVYCYDTEELENLFSGWKILQWQHVLITEQRAMNYGEWRIWAEK